MKKMDITIRGGIAERDINQRREAHCSYKILTWDKDESAAPNTYTQELCLGVHFQYDKPVKNRDRNGTSTTGRLRERHSIILCLFQVFLHLREEELSKLKINFVCDGADSRRVLDAITGTERPPFGWAGDIDELREKFAKCGEITTEFVTPDTIDAMIGEPFEFPEERRERLRQERNDKKIIS